MKEYAQQLKSTSAQLSDLSVRMNSTELADTAKLLNIIGNDIIKILNDEPLKYWIIYGEKK